MSRDVAVDVAAATGITRIMRSLLFGVRPTDPITFGGVVLLLLGAAWRSKATEPFLSCLTSYS